GCASRRAVLERSGDDTPDAVLEWRPRRPTQRGSRETWIADQRRTLGRAHLGRIGADRQREPAGGLHAVDEIPNRTALAGADVEDPVLSLVLRQRDQRLHDVV